MDNSDGVNTDESATKEQLEKAKANEAIKDGAKIAAKAYTGGMGGPLVDEAVDKIADSKVGQAVMDKINKNKMVRKNLAKAQPAAKAANGAMSMSSGGGASASGASLSSSSPQSIGIESSESITGSGNLGLGSGGGDKKTKIKLILGSMGCLVNFMLIVGIPLLVVIVIMSFIMDLGKADDSTKELKGKDQELYEKWGNLFTSQTPNKKEIDFFREFDKVTEDNKKKYDVDIDVPLLMATLNYYNNSSPNDQVDIEEENNNTTDFTGLKGDIKKLAEAMINERVVTVTKDNGNGTTSTTQVTEYYLDVEEDNSKYKTYLFDTYFEKNPLKKLLNGYDDTEKRNQKKEDMWKEILEIVELYKDAYKTTSTAGGFICGGVSPISNNEKTEYTVTSPFGMRYHPTQGIYKMHNGIDLASTGSNDNNVDIVAVADGKVSIGASCNEAMITIDHGTFKTRYIHLYSVTVSDGDTVTKGQIIGKMGGDPATGAVGSTGPHLHFEYFSDGVNNANPQEFLDNIGVDDNTCKELLNGGSVFVKIDPSGAENNSICSPNEKFGGDNVCSLETYIMGVVSAENDAGSLEALKAQAIASRTYFLNLVLKNKSYTETTTSDGETVKVATIQNNQSYQVYNINKYNSSSAAKKQDILNAVTATAGMVLTNNGKIFSSQYVSCPNTGFMYRIPSRNKVDANCSSSQKLGHNNGMAQWGANNFAKNGKDYKFILDYYYDAEIQPFSDDLV